MVPNLQPPTQPSMPPMPQSLMMGMGANPHGGDESPVCPACGQPLPMPFNNSNAPQMPIDPRLLGAQGMSPGGPPPFDPSMYSALMGGEGGR